MAVAKDCTRCGVVKPLEDFSPGLGRHGRSSWCKACHGEYDRENVEARRERKRRYRERHPDKMKEQRRDYERQNRDKVNARARFNHAVRTGKITRPDTCERCGTEGYVHGHHADYSKEYEVEWLCRDCHQIEHGKVVTT